MSNIVNNYTETDLGNISLNPRGEYDNSAAYEYLDTVSYQGGSYFCLAELETTITGIAPDSGHNSEHWQMIAAPGDMTPEYTAAYNNVINKAVQVETSRAAVELAQQEIEAVQTDVQQLHSDTVRAAQEAENSKNSAANSAQSAEQSRKTVSESEQNINGQIAGFDSRVSEAVEQSKEEINTTKQQAINTITNQQTTSVNTVKTEGEKIISRVGNDAKTVADDRATVEEATQTVLNNAQEVARNAQTVASNTENAAASAENAKTSADNAAQSAKSVEDASKQIEQNKKDVDSLKEDKADKTSLAQTDRKLDALWKLNQGISYEFQTDDTEAYQKTVPSGAKVANVKSIGGKTIVWNQLNLNSEKSTTKNGISFINNKDGSWTITGTCSASDGKSANTPIYLFSNKFVSGHKYLVKADKYFGENYGFAINGVSVPLKKAVIVNYRFNPIIFVKDKVTVDNVTMRMNIFDLTQMFGAGNEPSTPEEFEAMFPADYYPYNAGELMSAPVNEVIYLDTKNQEASYQIPQAILNLPGYGWSSGNARNEVNWENKQYIQRVDKVDLGTLNWVKPGDDQSVGNSTYKSGSLNTVIRRYSTYSGNSICEKFNIVKVKDINRNEYEYSIGPSGTAYPLQFTVKSTFCTDENDFKNKVNGIMLYYELAEPIVTDISDIIGNTFQEPLEVEAGGTLTFKNSHGDDYRIPVPSSEEYVISLAEVAK